MDQNGSHSNFRPMLLLLVLGLGVILLSNLYVRNPIISALRGTVVVALGSKVSYGLDLMNTIVVGHYGRNNAGSGFFAMMRSIIQWILSAFLSLVLLCCVNLPEWREWAADLPVVFNRMPSLWDVMSGEFWSIIGALRSAFRLLLTVVVQGRIAANAFRIDFTTGIYESGRAIRTCVIFLTAVGRLFQCLNERYNSFIEFLESHIRSHPEFVNQQNDAEEEVSGAEGGGSAR